MTGRDDPFEQIRIQLHNETVPLQRFKMTGLFFKIAVRCFCASGTCEALKHDSAIKIQTTVV